MVDQWTNILSDGREVTYTREWMHDTGGVVKAEVEGGVVTWTEAMPAALTREEVEEAFKAYLAK
jgi:hypothetical protein